MAAKSYSLDYDGYWRVPNISGLPANSGIYCVYALRAQCLREDSNASPAFCILARREMSATVSPSMSGGTTGSAN